MIATNKNKNNINSTSTKQNHRLAFRLFGQCCFTDTQAEILGQFLALVTAAGVGVACTCISYFYVEYSGEDTDIGSWGSFFTTYGTLFAIISGMVLVNVLERFNQLESVIEEELNAIESIRDSILYLRLEELSDTQGESSTLRNAFYRILLDYLKSIANEEWDLMALQDKRNNGAPDIDSDTSPQLLAIHQHVSDLVQTFERADGTRHNSTNNGSRSSSSHFRTEMLRTVIIPLILDLGKYRTNRLSLAEAQLPVLLKFLLIWMIFFLVIGFILLSVENLYVNAFMTVAVSGAIQWLYTIISDLDHPFYGIWNVSRTQLDKLIDKFEHQIKN
eukprot:scaffold19245_cov199-Amphora_coffeaeformis.AAC.28